MRYSSRTCFLAYCAVLMMGTLGLGQDVEPPFTWAGQGRGSLVSENSIEDFDFQFELSVDGQGLVSGQSRSDNAIAKIKHVFYTEKKEYELPGLFSRNIVIVFLLNEYSDTPLLCILNGRILLDKILYGEMLLARYEPGSDMAKALGVDDPEATLMEGDELPASLKSALKKCLPFGTAKIQGAYK